MDIDSHYTLGKEQIVSFRERGFIKLKEVISPDVIAHFGAEFTQVVQAHNQQKLPMEERNTMDGRNIAPRRITRRDPAK